MNSQTVGHISTNGGIRGHSAGDVFPAIIMIKGNPFGIQTYHVLQHPRLDPDVGYVSYAIAHSWASLTPRF